MAKKLNIGLIGAGFMGKAHSNALRQVPAFFPELEYQPVMKTICSAPRDEAQARELQKRFGWEQLSLDWKAVVEDPEIDAVDISVPGAMHCEVAIAAAKAGKHIFCEKPFSATMEEANAMYSAVNETGVYHLVNFCYRRVPAVELARELIEEGRIGEIFSFNGFYQQDWAIDPEMPLAWRMEMKNVGPGPGEAGSHICDIARMLAGDFDSVADGGAVFIKERKTPADPNVRAAVTSNDDDVFISRFKSGALGVFHTSRVSSGRRNQLMFEINGSKGSIRFELERLNELQVFYREGRECLEGFKTILVNNSQQKYEGRWWPSGHIIGWEHLFTHQYAEFLTAIQQNRQPKPNFLDGLKNQQVIIALGIADNEKRWVSVDEVK